MSPPVEERRVHPLAADLNETLRDQAPEVFEMLSAYGRRIYFPKGILSQSAEAKAKAYRFNATIGIATEGGEAMHLESIQQHLQGMDPDEVYPYAPASGRPGLRSHWRAKLEGENPSLKGKAFGLPIVTSAITHGISLVGELFLDPEDVVLLPDKLWGNYRLSYEVRIGARIETYPFYRGGGFDVDALEARLAEVSRGRQKVMVLLNFPNNPTGYMPTAPEADRIVEVLRQQAERGTKLVVVADDAYFGLFYHLGGASSTESLFARLTGLHENLLAVKLDGATKELFVWGLRCGFITFGPGRSDTSESVCQALEAKVKGAIRGGISNVPQLSQSLVERALTSPTIDQERAQKHEVLRARAERVFEICNQPRFAESWSVYPFNSGYFMCVQVHGVDAEAVRLHLLDEFGMGLISTSSTDLRIAFSCLEVDQVEPLFEALHKGIQDLRSV
ncbi:MAG: aminotransferase class I/II-fold pyridoxal phosphate-dependent enzyme [Myxococcota bacterium]|nr:aminotransferase class I/II-fold pyridoxal phosphate-dependent enzyme [Myxococcota bacterium]